MPFRNAVESRNSSSPGPASVLDFLLPPQVSSNDADDETALVVPLHDDDDVINKMNLVAGLYNNEQIWLDDVHEASVVETSSVDDCVLKVEQLAPDLTLCIGHKHHLSVKRFHYD